jgi:hypothetical protein
MQLADAKSAYQDLSGKASDIVRQLSLAGVGIVWIFRSGGDNPAIERDLLRAALFIFSALLCDFLQYFVGTVIWFLYFRSQEKRGVSLTDEVLAPVALTWPTWIIFYLKSVMMSHMRCTSFRS